MRILNCVCVLVSLLNRTEVRLPFYRSNKLLNILKDFEHYNYMVLSCILEKVSFLVFGFLLSTHNRKVFLDCNTGSVRCQETLCLKTYDNFTYFYRSNSKCVMVWRFLYET